MHESKLIDIFEYIEEKCIIGQQPQNKFIVCDLVSHLKDICTEKRFTELERTLLVKDLPGYKEIFQCFVDFENELHKKNCIIFLPLNGAKEQMLKMPKLRLKLFGKKDKCSCSENFLDKVKDISNDLPESMVCSDLLLRLRTLL
ncbi:uncharacterized protein LOC132724056 [Ruditapes philippinarum]|uniref:uncharacterized protein LOC132724056 n=1 Tax=Ruditapes philippinarum TaxID=129788 RepID=UPI00295A8775|nr:uncharacterized protein LOC132724056 [Ruditapes philippinarum]